MPLSGERILVTRGEGQAGEFAGLIRKRGGVPVLFPTIRLVPPEDTAPLDGSIARLSEFDWVLFASANAAKFFCARASLLGVARKPEGVRVASVGPGTSRELERLGFPADLTAGKHTGEGLADALRGEGVAGKRFLLPRALEGRDVISAEIRRHGGAVESVVAYRNGLPERNEGAAREMEADPPDVCTFASPSAFRNFFLLMGERAAAEVLMRSRIAAIGEVTARAVAERKFEVDIMPEKYTLKGLMDAIEVRLASLPRDGGPNR
ncbi:MAG: uroporphyrinogen-III synthase [Deltaproteobacteria bacterium]|nr:uroporphyrinogen-III synthase [Deltaproteobacteria bacterium]